MPKRIAAKDEVIWMTWCRYTERWDPTYWGYGHDRVLAWIRSEGEKPSDYVIRRVRLSEVTPNKRKAKVKR